jgi:TM2 domain-containing membrane protein YozV
MYLIGQLFTMEAVHQHAVPGNMQWNREDMFMKSGHALVAALCSSLIPGVGQIIAGRWRRGWVLLIGTLALLGLALGVWLQGTDVLLDLLVRPSVLLGLLAVNAFVLCVRLFATLDAYRLIAAPSGSARRAWALHRQRRSRTIGML